MKQKTKWATHAGYMGRPWLLGSGAGFEPATFAGNHQPELDTLVGLIIYEAQSGRFLKI